MCAPEVSSAINASLQALHPTTALAGNAGVVWPCGISQPLRSRKADLNRECPGKLRPEPNYERRLQETTFIVMSTAH